MPAYTEYMSPEMIFNLGHDKATDVWSAGVLLYEMVMAVTPFAAKRADNMRELFTKIGAFEVCIYIYNVDIRIYRVYDTLPFFTPPFACRSLFNLHMCFLSLIY